MRNELGIFKAEQVEVLHALDLEKQLPDSHSFKKRGHRRQSAYLKQSTLPYALRIARMEMAQPAQEISFWESQLTRVQN